MYLIKARDRRNAEIVDSSVGEGGAEKVAGGEGKAEMSVEADARFSSSSDSMCGIWKEKETFFLILRGEAPGVRGGADWAVLRVGVTFPSEPE